MSIEWWVREGGQVHGPFTQEQVIGLASQGKVKADTELRLGRTTAWVTASQQVWLKSILNPELDEIDRDIVRPVAALGRLNMTNSSKSSTGLIAAGYICGGLSLLIVPPALGLAGTVIGVVNLTKGSTGHGIAQIIISVTCGLFGMIIGASLMSG